MTVIRALAGWITFAVVGAFADTSVAAGAALAAAMVSLALGLYVRRSLAATLIECATAAFFAVLFLLAVTCPALERFDSWICVASQVWLGVTVAVTLAIKRPFTLPIAAREAPPEIVATRRFYRFNVEITRAWMISFLVSALVVAAAIVFGLTQSWVSTVIVVISIAVPLRYTHYRVAALRDVVGAERVN